MMGTGDEWLSTVGGGSAVAAGSGQVRVVSEDGRVWGAGVLTASWVLTCAHVVTSALGRGAGPKGGLWVDRPGDSGGRVRAVVAEGGWFPGPAEKAGVDRAHDIDLAVLSLPDGRPPEWEQGVLGGQELTPRRRVRAMGYPRSAQGGVWMAAVLAGQGGPHPRWVQLDAVSSVGARVERGFSGAPVWDEETSNCVGLMTAAMTDHAMRVAWMVPMDVVSECWPGLLSERTAPSTSSRQGGRSSSPGGLPSVPDLFALTDALLRMPQVGRDRGQTLRDLLPEVIRHQVYEHPEVRLQVFRIVEACTSLPQGRSALVEAVTLLGGASTAAADALEALRQLWGPGGETGRERRGAR